MGQQTIGGQFPAAQTSGSEVLAVTSNAGTASNDSAVGGTYPWTLNAYPITAGPLPATAASTEGLRFSGLNFNVPTIATIVGVQVTLTRAYSGGGYAPDLYTQFIGLTGTTLPLTSTNRAINFASWPPSPPTEEGFGGIFDLWNNTTITPAQVNSIAFGIELYATSAGSDSGRIAQVYGFRVAVYYTLPGVNGVILADASLDGFGDSEWTQGGAVFLATQAQPTLIGPWSIVGYSVAFQGIMFAPTSSLPSYGQLGSVWGGLLFNQITPPNLAGNNWMNPMPQFPSGSALVNQLWDGTTDTQFPWANLATPTQPARFLTYTQPLPLAVTMQPGENLTIALWLTPSLSQNVQLLICNATYEIVYDDSPQNT
jgi:hypothetical protein